MAGSKKKWVAFKGNVTVPAEMVGGKEDQKVQAGEAVQVPEFYADSVVQDGIAEYSAAPKKKPASKKKAEPTAEEGAAAEKAEKLAEAEKAVTEAQDALNAAEGTDGAEAARATLLAAQEALAELQG